MVHEYPKSNSYDPNRIPWIGSHFADLFGECQTYIYQSNQE